MRVFMSIDNQRRFVRGVKMRCNLTWKEFGKQCRVSGQTAKVNYYYRGNTLPSDCAGHISKISGIELPPHVLLPDNWGQVKGGLAFLHKSLSKNPGLCEDLAEFIGILLGDGCIFKSYSKKEQKHFFFVLVTGHLHDLKYYQSTVRPLVRKLFHVSGYMQRRENTLAFLIKSRRIYDFLRSADMPDGEKVRNEALSIPEWITQKPEFLKACIRGITDTDGSVFRSGKGARIQYKFASKSLTKSMQNALISLGYHPTQVRRTESFNKERNYIGWRFYLSRQNEIDRFVYDIGFRNNWHKKRYLKLRNHGKFSPVRIPSPAP